MCTLIVLDRVIPGSPLVVASNRDEFFSRPAARPARVEAAKNGHPAFVAPQDLVAGGTWMGLNAKGLFVGLTNRRTTDLRTDRRSRGLLVRDSLGRRSAPEVARYVRQGLEGTYNPFHMFYADGHRGFLTCLREDGAETRELGPGLRVLGNRDPEDPASDKIARIAHAVEGIPLDRSSQEVCRQLRTILSSHSGGEDPLEHVCVHTPAYGTRSSSILACGNDRWHYWYAAGPPCKSKYQDYTRLLDDLRQAVTPNERT